MIIVERCERAKEFTKNSNCFRLLKKRKFVTFVLFRYNETNNLRVFLREEVGKVQHVVWLSEKELSDWVNSSVESHFHFTKPKSVEKRMASAFK